MIANGDKETTRITICKRDYRIENKGRQPLYVQRLADILDKKLNEIGQREGLVDSYALLVNAALEIIDEKLKLQDNKADSSQKIDREIEELTSKLNKTL